MSLRLCMGKRVTAVAGLWRYDGSGGAGQGVARMGSAMAAYGRDAAGQCEVGGIGLALTCHQSHITDTDQIDRQPLWDRSGALCVVADARIDNGAELAAAFGWPLQESGRTSDAALILAAYRQWGPDSVNRLFGDFAFALWDGQTQQLLLARDHHGSRPLFFARRPGLFAFASVPRGLLALGDFSSALDEREIAAYLARVPQASGTTLYRDLSSLPPGHFLLVRGERQQLVSYWPTPSVEPVKASDYQGHVEELRRLYDEAVRVRLRVRPGGAIGSHLSAGFDSSSVTALAARALSAQGKRLTAFTAAPRAGFVRPGPQSAMLDESVGAAEIARAVPGIDHCIVRTGPQSLMRTLEQDLPFLDIPPLNPCNRRWFHLVEQEAARRGIKVLLHGSAGNLTVSFDGRPQFLNLFRQGRWWSLAKLARCASRNGESLRGIATMVINRSLVPLLRRRWQGRRDLTFVYSALSPAFATAVDLTGLAAERGLFLTPEQPVWSVASPRLQVLRTVEPALYHHATLAYAGVETTDPTADRRVVDFCLRTPEAFFIWQGRSASLFRDALQGILPQSVLDRRIRGTQAADWMEGLMAGRDDIADELDRLAASPLASRALDLDRMRGIVAAIPDPSTPVEDLQRLWNQNREMYSAFRSVLQRGLAVGRFIRMTEGGNG